MAPSRVAIEIVFPKLVFLYGMCENVEYGNDYEKDIPLNAFSCTRNIPSPSNVIENGVSKFGGNLPHGKPSFSNASFLFV